MKPEKEQAYLDRIAELEKELKRTHHKIKKDTYGLHWLDVPEAFEDDVENKLPILKEVKDKAIVNDDGKPTHILIEGDNYHALTCLNYTHKGKIDIIYIDPPYNTGTDGFKYRDKRFLTEFPDGQIIDKNHPARHSVWLSFMKKRLEIAKNLLCNTGVIFMSIDDNELAQLTLLCNSIFDSNQYVGILVWEKKKKGSHLSDSITNVKEFVLVYCKNRSSFPGLIGQVAREKETYPCINPGNDMGIRIIPKGIKSNFKEKNYTLPSGHIISDGNQQLRLLSILVIENGVLAKDVKVESEWRYTQDKIDEFASKGTLYITTKLYLRNIVVHPRQKKLKDILFRVEKDTLIDLKDRLIKKLEAEEYDGELDLIKSQIENIENGDYNSFNVDNLYADGWGSNEDGDNELRGFFGKKVFDYPKPVKLIQKLIASTDVRTGIVLDFFAGTGTTGQSVINLNDSMRSLQFILCTNNEDANKSGDKIAEDICYPRIQKVIRGYKNRKTNENTGSGGNSLKYFRTDFVGEHDILGANDEDKSELAHHAGEMLAIAENTLYEMERLQTDFYQFFQNENRYTAVYFREELDHFEEFRERALALEKPVAVYVFSWGENEFADQFEDRDDIEVKPIPQPILEVYKRIYDLSS